MRDGQLSEACLTNPCGRLTYRGGTVKLADGPRSPAQQVQGGARTINSIPEVKWEPSAPEVKRLTLSQSLSEKNGHQSCLPVRVFAIFCNVSRCKRSKAMSHNIYIFNPGDSHMKGAGMLVENFELNPLRRPTWAWTNLSLTPKRDHFVTMLFGY